jgi:hypothetical protein
MSLFSDVDWVILGVAALFLLLGGNNTEMLRTAGRLYGKVMRLRDEFLQQLRTATEVPSAPAGPAPATASPAPVARAAPSPTPLTPGVFAVGEVRVLEPLPSEERFRGYQ